MLPIHEDHYRRLLQFELTQTKRLNMSRLQRYIVNRRYFYGENEDSDTIRQPLGIRYVPTVNQKHTHYLFGEWEGDIVGWLVRPWDADDANDSDFEVAAAVQRAILRIMRRCNANRTLYKAALDGSVYGDSVLKIGYNPQVGGANVEAILPEYYHALWHPLEPSNTIEGCIAFNMDRTAAHSLYGTVGNRQYFPTGTFLNTNLAICWEYWNAYEKIVAVDDEIVLRERNPFSEVTRDGEITAGRLPFVHVPNLGANGEYWGFGDAEQVFRLADELNYRMADIGDVINYHAHPITLLRNFYGDVEQLPVSADAVWDLGREGEASYLEWGGPAPEVMKYIEMLLRIVLETTSLTPIAFGHSESSQASSAALNIQMLPITEVVRRKRAFWGPALTDLALGMLRLESMLLEEQASGKFRRTYGFALSDLERFEVTPKWSPILPRDRLAVVNEQVALLSNHAKSIVTALTDLEVDDPLVERERIMADIKAIADIEAKINKEIATHEANLNMKMAEQQHAQTVEQSKLQMRQSEQQHRQTMEADPTTDPERHKRHIERVRTEHEEERKTTEVRMKAKQVSASRIAVQTGGKNSDRAKGGSNQDGGQ